MSRRASLKSFHEYTSPKRSTFDLRSPKRRAVAEKHRVCHPGLRLCRWLPYSASYRPWGLKSQFSRSRDKRAKNVLPHTNILLHGTPVNTPVMIKKDKPETIIPCRYTQLLGTDTVDTQTHRRNNNRTLCTNYNTSNPTLQTQGSNLP